MINFDEGSMSDFIRYQEFINYLLNKEFDKVYYKIYPEVEPIGMNPTITLKENIDREWDW